MLRPVDRADGWMPNVLVGHRQLAEEWRQLRDLAAELYE